LHGSCLLSVNIQYSKPFDQSCLSDDSLLGWWSDGGN